MPNGLIELGMIGISILAVDGAFEADDGHVFLVLGGCSRIFCIASAEGMLIKHMNN